MNISADAFRLGEEVCGPAFVPFCDWVVQEASAANIKHILFLARDGQLLKKITDLRYPGLDSIDTHYCYAGSRASWYRCTPHAISRGILEFRIRTEYLTLGKTCTALGFEPEPLANRLGLSPGQKLNPAAQQRLARFLTGPEGRKLLFSLTQKNRDVLIAYLAQLGVEAGESLAIIDVGWNGHFQSSLEIVLKPLGIDVHGFYYGLNRRHFGSRRKHFVYGPEEYPHWISFYPCLIESLTPADHPTVSILEQQGDQVVPLFTGPPVADPEIIGDIHSGALSYAAHASDQQGDSLLEQFVKHPPSYAIRVFSEFYFQKPFSPEVEESFIQKHSFLRASWLAWSCRRNLAEWHWPQANLKASKLGFMGKGLNSRFRIGHRVGRSIDRSKRLLSNAISLGLAMTGGIFDFRNHQLISFDIFDTLLFRQCGGYFRIFEEMENKTGIEGLAQRRKSTEIQLLLELKREIKLDEIYLALEEKMPVHDWAGIRKLELELEEENLRPSARGMRSLRTARKSGAKILFLSDMYLSGEWIEDQLRRHSIWREGDMLFVSNEMDANKRSGDLFDVIRDKYPGLSWRHSGDNLLSDVLSGYRAGVSVRWLPHSYLQSIRDHLFRLKNRSRWLSK